jgi:hypothetical protein
MTGTDLCVNKCKQFRSYLNHLVYYKCGRGPGVWDAWSVTTQRKVNVGDFLLIMYTTSKFVERNEEKYIKGVKRKLGHAIACSQCLFPVLI